MIASLRDKPAATATSSLVAGGIVGAYAASSCGTQTLNGGVGSVKADVAASNETPS